MIEKAGPPRCLSACKAEPRPARPTTSSAISSVMPIVNVKIMYGMMKPEPPLMPAQNGNFQIEPKPIAEPAPAKIKPILEPQVVAVVAMFFLVCLC